MKKKVIGIVTGSRAEYGLLAPLIEAVDETPELELQLIVTGSHLSERYGSTVDEILSAGHQVSARVDLELNEDTQKAIASSMGRAMIGFAKVFSERCLDVLVLLGDRFEIYAVAGAAVVFNIPIAHLHGGERSEGANDELFRHAVTKMSHLHFTSTEEYRNRVIQMGESPDRVFCVGAIGLDNLERLKLLDENELEESLGFRLGRKNLLVTYHPVTLERDSPSAQFSELLGALECFTDTTIVFTNPNADSGNSEISEMIDAFVARNPGRSTSCVSMGQLLYLSALKYVDAVVGNSSSGIIEAPSLHTPTVNIGLRQSGRVKPPSVVDCGSDKTSIVKAINDVYDEKFRSKLSSFGNPYYQPRVAERVCGVLRNTDFESLGVKEFFDR